MTIGFAQNLEEIIRDYFADQDGVAAVYLFGSHAAGKQRPASDVDIAILLSPYHADAEHARRTLYMTELSRLTRAVVHPVILNSAGEMLLKQILSKGKCICLKDSKLLAHFKMTAIARVAAYGYYQHLFQKSVIRQIVGGDNHA